MFYVYTLLGILLRSQVFEVNNGNDDWMDLEHPEKYGLTQTQNFYMQHDDSPQDKIGAWFVRAKSEVEDLDINTCPKEGCPKKTLENMPKLGPDDTVFILFHGNAKNRGASHRIAAYQLFQKQGYHTLTLDPRGYGDSTISSELNETSVVNDAIMAMRFVRKELGDQVKLIIYGHSMGTGVGTRAIVQCTKDKTARVDGVILDSPMHSITYALKQSPNFYYYSSLIFDWQRFAEIAGLEFNVAKWVTMIECPVTIFHAELDHVAPISGSEQIVKDAKDSGKTNIKLIRFKEEGLGHIGISKHPDFPKVVREAVIEAHSYYNKKKSNM